MVCIGIIVKDKVYISIGINFISMGGGGVEWGGGCIDEVY